MPVKITEVTGRDLDLLVHKALGIELKPLVEDSVGRIPFEFDLCHDIKHLREVDAILAGEPHCSGLDADELKRVILDFGYSYGDPVALPYSSDWSIGGPFITEQGIDIHQIKTKPYKIIELRHFNADLGDVMEYVPGHKREMALRPRKPSQHEGKWLARMAVDNHPFGWKPDDFMSDEPLIAAARCFVASKFGREITQ